MSTESMVIDYVTYIDVYHFHNTQYIYIYITPSINGIARHHIAIKQLSRLSITYYVICYSFSSHPIIKSLNSEATTHMQGPLHSQFPNKPPRKIKTKPVSVVNSNAKQMN